MKGAYFESRAEQVEKETLKALMKLIGPRNKQMRSRILALLHEAAFCASCGERDRTIEILSKSANTDEAIREIRAKSVGDVFKGI